MNKQQSNSQHRNRSKSATDASDLKTVYSNEAPQADQPVLSTPKSQNEYLDQIEQRLNSLLKRMRDQQDDMIRQSIEQRLRERVKPDHKQIHPRGTWLLALLDDLVVDIDMSNSHENATQTTDGKELSDPHDATTQVTAPSTATESQNHTVLDNACEHTQE